MEEGGGCFAVAFLVGLELFLRLDDTGAAESSITSESSLSLRSWSGCFVVVVDAGAVDSFTSSSPPSTLTAAFCLGLPAEDGLALRDDGTGESVFFTFFAALDGASWDLRFLLLLLVVAFRGVSSAAEGALITLDAFESEFESAWGSCSDSGSDTGLGLFFWRLRGLDASALGDASLEPFFGFDRSDGAADLELLVGLATGLDVGSCWLLAASSVCYYDAGQMIRDACCKDASLFFIMTENHGCNDH